MKTLVSKTTGFLATFLMLLIAPSGVAFANQGTVPEAVAGEAVIKFTGSGEPSASELGVLSVSKVGLENYLVQLDPFLSQASELARLEAREDVEYAEPNYKLALTATSDDPGYLDGSTWGLYGTGSTPSSSHGANAAGAWANGFTGNKQVYVAVIDSGVDVSHPDLAGNMWVNSGEVAGDGIDNDGNGYVDDVHGYDFLNNDGSVFDAGEHPHGTHVAGTIGAVGGNGAGVAGVMWNVNLITAKTINSAGNADLASTIAAIDYITDLRTKKGLDIIASNNSWGGTRYSQALENAIKRGGDAGIIFVAAAGNDASNLDSTPQYPAAYDCSTTHRTFDCVVSVAAINQSGGLAGYSNYSVTRVDIAAPGSNVYSTMPGNSYGLLSGTSMAAPHVTGALALCVASYRGTSGLSAIQNLMATATANAALSGKVASGGHLNVSALVDSCVSSAATFSGALASAQATAEYKDRARLDWADLSVGDYEQEIQVAVGPNGCRGTFSHLAYIGPGLDSYPVHELEEAQFYCFRVRAIKDGAVSAWATSNVTITWTSNLPFIQGRVLLSDGVTPVANAPVRWLASGSYAGSDDQNALLAFTNASGEYFIQVPNGTEGELFVGMSRHAKTGRMTTPTIPWGLRAGGKLTISEDATVDITLPPFHNLTFTLIDDVTNQPIQGVTTQYDNLADHCKRGSYTAFPGAAESTCQAWPTGYTSSAAQTDSNGQVVLSFLDGSILTRTSHTIAFKHPTNPNRVTSSTFTPTADTSVNLRMGDLIVLSGTAFMSDGVTPIQNAVVKWLPSGSARSGENSNALSTKTDASGQYSLNVTSGVSGELSLHSPRAANTVPATSPLLAHGIWSWGYMSAFAESKVVNLVAPRQHNVTFKVNDQRGNPIANALFRSADLGVHCRQNFEPVFSGAVNPGCQAWPTGISQVLRTNSNGELLLPLLDLGQVSAKTYRLSIAHPTNASLTATVELAPTSDMVMPITISDEVTVSGRVLTADGAPVSNMTVKWLPSGTPESMGNEQVPGVRTDSNGNYSMQISAGTTGQLFAWTTRVPSEAEKTVPLTPWGLHAGGTLTINGETSKDIVLPAIYYQNFTVREFGSNDPVVNAKFVYGQLGESCKSGSYTAFEGASDSRCAFWPVGYPHAGLKSDEDGRVTIPVFDRNLFHSKAYYELTVTHPMDPSRVASSRVSVMANSELAIEMPGTPSRPEQPEATALTNEVQLSWQEPWNGGAYIDYYKVWVSLNADGPFELVTSGSCAGNIAPELRSCVVTGLQAGVTYYFAIIAHNVVGYSDRSLAVAATPHAAILSFAQAPAPVIPAATVGLNGRATVGQWDQGAQLSYQWLRNGQPIAGAVFDEYTPTPLDAGQNLSLEVTGRKTGHESATRVSPQVVVVWPSAIQLVRLDGETTVGSIIQALPSEILDGMALTFQWYRNGAAITGAIDQFYEISTPDLGSALSVVISGEGLDGAPVQSKVAQASLPPAPAPVQPPAFVPEPPVEEPNNEPVIDPPPATLPPVVVAEVGKVLLSADESQLVRGENTTLRVRVLDVSDLGLSGELVEFSVFGAGYVGLPNATTNASGEISLTLVSSGTGLVTITATAGGKSATIQLTVVAPVAATAQSVEVSVSSKAIEPGRNADVVIMVIDTEGKPYAYKTVLVYSTGAGYLSSQNVTTDGEGRAVVKLLTGSGDSGVASITASVDGISATTTLSVQAPEVVPVKVVLGSFQGRWAVRVENAVVGDRLIIKAGANWYVFTIRSETELFSRKSVVGSELAVKVWVDGVAVAGGNIVIK